MVEEGVIKIPGVLHPIKFADEALKLTYKKPLDKYKNELNKYRQEYREFSNEEKKEFKKRLKAKLGSPAAMLILDYITEE